MFESALGNLCIVICGMTVLLSAFFIWRTETLPNRLIVAAAAALVLIFRWQTSSWRPSSRSSRCSWALCCSAPCPLCSSVSSCTEGGERMEYAFTLNVLPVVGGVVIVLVLVLCELGSTGFGCGLPSGGYRYYIGEHTVLYLRQSGKRCRAYVLEGEAPPAVPLHHSRGGTYFKVWAASPAEAELEIEQAYQRRPELEQ